MSDTIPTTKLTTPQIPDEEARIYPHPTTQDLDIPDLDIPDLGRVPFTLASSWGEATNFSTSNDSTSNDSLPTIKAYNPDAGFAKWRVNPEDPTTYVVRLDDGRALVFTI